eukprot:CAMPEP_0172393024 /NCGR_PEP_ID=MMETSP1061-20121228/9002_1 /TAXON_ID=37318 /ORGANISM="Pseudo-nitzschia pungens, Strain cf. pungens" /LENGTH=111 /DNA_ID=CAMNT_0013123985 /DNA_START=106 /DNA_END=437 /DNA_ORIENTATION=-
MRSPSVLPLCAMLGTLLVPEVVRTTTALQTAPKPMSKGKASGGSSTGGYTPPVPPPISPATNLPNELYQWKEGQQIRYQRAGPLDGKPVLLVHGLFVNSDHWRKTIEGLAA